MRKFIDEIIAKIKQPGWVNQYLGRNYAPALKTNQLKFNWDKYQLPPDWLDRLSVLLFKQFDASSVRLDQPITKDLIQKKLIEHTSGDGKIKRDVKKYLIRIFAVLADANKLDQASKPQLTDQALQLVAIELVEGLVHCTDGMSERVQAIWQRWETPASITGLLSSYRKELIENLARNNFITDRISGAFETHRVNFYLSVANQIGANIPGVADTHIEEQYYDNVDDKNAVSQYIENELRTKYNPLGIMRFIEAQLLDVTQFTPPEKPTLDFPTHTPEDATQLKQYEAKVKAYETAVNHNNENAMTILKSIFERLDINKTVEEQKEYLLSKRISLSEKIKLADEPPTSMILFTGIDLKELRLLIYQTLIDLAIIATPKDKSKIELRPSLENDQQFDYWLFNIAEPEDIVDWLRESAKPDIIQFLKLCYKSEKRYIALFEAFSSQEQAPMLKSIENTAIDIIKQKQNLKIKNNLLNESRAEVAENCLFINSKWDDVTNKATDIFIEYRKHTRKIDDALKKITSPQRRTEVIIQTILQFKKDKSSMSSFMESIPTLLELTPKDQWSHLIKTLLPDNIPQETALKTYLVLNKLKTDEEKNNYLAVLNSCINDITNRLFDSTQTTQYVRAAAGINILSATPPANKLALIEHAIRTNQTSKLCMEKHLLGFFNALDEQTQNTLLKNERLIWQVLAHSGYSDGKIAETEKIELINTLNNAIRHSENRLVFLQYLQKDWPATFKMLTAGLDELVALLPGFENHAESAHQLFALFPAINADQLIEKDFFAVLQTLNILLQTLPREDIQLLLQPIIWPSIIKKMTNLNQKPRYEQNDVNNFLKLLEMAGKKIPELQKELIDHLIDPENTPVIIQWIENNHDSVNINVLWILEIIADPIQKKKFIESLLKIDSTKNPHSQFIMLPRGKLISAIQLLNAEEQVAIFNSEPHPKYLSKLMKKMSLHEWVELFKILPDVTKTEICKFLDEYLLLWLPREEDNALLLLLPKNISTNLKKIIIERLTHGNLIITSLPKYNWPTKQGIDMDGVNNILSNISQDQTAYKNFIDTVMVDDTNKLDIDYLVNLIFSHPAQLNMLLSVLEPESIEELKGKMDSAPAALNDFLNKMRMQFLEKKNKLIDGNLLKKVLDLLSNTRQQEMIHKIGLENIFANRKKNDWIEIANMLTIITPDEWKVIVEKYQSPSQTSEWVLASPTGESFSEHHELLDALKDLTSDHVITLLASLKHPMFNTIDELASMLFSMKNSRKKQFAFISCLNPADLAQLSKLINEENATLSDVMAALQNQNIKEFINKLGDDKFILHLPAHIRNTLFSSIPNIADRCKLEMHYISELATPTPIADINIALHGITKQRNMIKQNRVVDWLIASLTTMSDFAKQIYIDTIGIKKIAALPKTAEQCYAIRALLPEGPNYKIVFVDDAKPFPGSLDENCIYVFNAYKTDVNEDGAEIIAREITYLIGIDDQYTTGILNMDGLSANAASIDAHQNEIIAKVIDDRNGLNKYQTLFSTEIEKKSPELADALKNYTADLQTELNKIKTGLSASIDIDIEKIKNKKLTVLTGKADAATITMLLELKKTIQDSSDKSAIMMQLIKMQENPEEKKQVKEFLKNYLDVCNRPVSQQNVRSQR